MTYRVGDSITHPKLGERFVFAGYAEDGCETWCDVMTTDWGKEALTEPERRTFVGFTEDGTRWRQSADEFAEAVDHEMKPH